jgi:hypothetical protein
VIRAVVLVPHPPLLMRELGGIEDPVAELRANVVDAARSMVDGADEVVVVGSADDARDWPASTGFDLHRFGTTDPPLPHPGLPLSLGVGVRLLRGSGWKGDISTVAVGRRASDEELEQLAGSLTGRERATAVLLLGDGSARRGERAPGYLDERAFAFDDTVAKALADGDAAALAHLDTELAADLMVHGAAAFRLLGRLALQQEGPPHAALTYRADPFGVSYFVATWTFLALRPSSVSRSGST